VVLLKEISPEGLIFFTNYKSQKAQQIKAHPEVSALMFWPSLERQVRIKGSVTKLSEADSTDYFRTRPRDSQLGAWASPQSEIIENRGQLDQSVEHYNELFGDNEIPKPEHWGGFLIQPHRFEFWQGRSNRLHDRLAYSLNQQQWIIHRLAP
jgi:pyridoxamine 5'-phosphate oxidase